MILYQRSLIVSMLYLKKIKIEAAKIIVASRGFLSLIVDENMKHRGFFVENVFRAGEIEGIF